MKIYYYILFSLLSVVTLQAQNTIINEANALIADQKYATAYEYLKDRDPNDMDPDVAISKSNLLLNYYIKTRQFQEFGLKDLAPNQDLHQLRENNATVRMFVYKPDSILNKLIRQYPTNYKLRNALGNFYYEVHLKYPEDWLLPDSVVVLNMKNNYEEANNNEVFDYWSLFGIGYAYLLEDEYEKAIPYLKKSTELNSSYSLSHYNLAFAYSNTDQPHECLASAQKAFELQVMPEYKAEAARLIAMTYEDLKEDKKALEYYRIANQTLPNDYNTLSLLLALEIKLNDVQYKKHANQLFYLDPDNPVIFQDLLKMYSENEKETEFIEMMEDLKPLFRQNIPVMANILFHQAIAQYETEEWVSAKINFERARSLFRNLYSSGHSVFKVIDSYTNVIKKKKSS